MQCPWCKQFTPIFEKVAGEYAGKVKFAKLNVLKSPSNREIASNFGVMATSTLVFFCGGRPLMHVVGLTSEENLKKTIEDVLSRYRTCLRQSTDLRSYIV